MYEAIQDDLLRYKAPNEPKTQNQTIDATSTKDDMAKQKGKVTKKPTSTSTAAKRTAAASFTLTSIDSVKLANLIRSKQASLRAMHGDPFLIKFYQDMLDRTNYRYVAGILNDSKAIHEMYDVLQFMWNSFFENSKVEMSNMASTLYDDHDNGPGSGGPKKPKYGGPKWDEDYEEDPSPDRGNCNHSGSTASNRNHGSNDGNKHDANSTIRSDSEHYYSDNGDSNDFSEVMSRYKSLHSITARNMILAQ